METVRFGVIGIGNIGSMHARNLYEGRIPRATLSAVCDINAERLDKAVKAYGISGYYDYTALLASGEVDAVIVSVPHYLHCEIAIAAMRAGLHVLIEKPAGVRVSDVKKMNQAANEYGTVFGIMFNQRTNLLFQKARELVKGGTLGKRKRLSWTVTNWYRTQSYYDSGAWRATWRGEGGGVLLNQAPHNLDLLQWIFGMPDRIRAICREGLYHNITVEDYAAIYGEYDDGASMQFLTTTGELPGTNRLEIVGDRGKIVLEEGKLKLWRLKESEESVRFSSSEGMPRIEMDYEELSLDAPESAHCGIIENFVGAILDGTLLLADGREGIHQLMLTNAAYLSSWTGQSVTLPIDEALFDQYHEEKRISEEEKPFCEESGGEEHLPRWQVNW